MADIAFDLEEIGLPVGEHIIRIRLSDDDVTKSDSLASNSVTYTVSPQTFTISTNLFNIVGNASNPTTIQSGGTATLYFSSDYGYDLPNSVSVGGATVDSWDSLSGKLMLMNPTTNVTITISGELGDDYCTIRTKLTGVTASSTNPTVVRKGLTEIFTFTADSGYNLPDRDEITVVGGTFSWNKLMGTMVLAVSAQNPKNFVTISMAGVPIQQGETWLINANGGAFWGYPFTANITFDSFGEDEYRTFNTFVYGETYLQYDNGVVYNSLGWRDEGYRTVYFHTAPTGELLAYLTANAVKQQ